MRLQGGEVSGQVESRRFEQRLLPPVLRGGPGATHRERAIGAGFALLVMTLGMTREPLRTTGPARITRAAPSTKESDGYALPTASQSTSGPAVSARLTVATGRHQR